MYISRTRTAHREQYGGRPCAGAEIERRACPVLPLGELLAGQRSYSKVRYWQVKGRMARSMRGIGRSKVVWQGEVFAGQRWYGKVRYWQVKGGMAR